MLKVDRVFAWSLCVALLTGLLSGCAQPRPAQESAPSMPTATVTTQSLTPSASSGASATPTATTKPTPSGPTIGPNSQHPITKTCASTPTRPPYVGLCKVKGQSDLTGRQAFNACKAAALHDLWEGTDKKYGLKDDDKADDVNLCAASIGLKLGLVHGMPAENDRHRLLYFTVQGMGMNGQIWGELPFVAATGNLTVQDDVLESIGAWRETHLTQGG